MVDSAISFYDTLSFGRLRRLLSQGACTEAQRWQVVAELRRLRGEPHETEAWAYVEANRGASGEALGYVLELEREHRFILEGLFGQRALPFEGLRELETFDLSPDVVIGQAELLDLSYRPDWLPRNLYAAHRTGAHIILFAWGSDGFYSLWRPSPEFQLCDCPVCFLDAELEPIGPVAIDLESFFSLVVAFGGACVMPINDYIDPVEILAVSGGEASWRTPGRFATAHGISAATDPAKLLESAWREYGRGYLEWSAHLAGE